LSHSHRHPNATEYADNARPIYPGNSFNPPRPLLPPLLHGFRRRCPACGIGQLFTRYLKVAPFCSCCGEALHHARPDDAPPYFVMLIVGHVAVSFALALEETSAPPLWLTLLATMAIACVLTFALLPPVKGAIIALQWIFWMHGFDAYETDEPTETRPQTLHAAAAARGPALPAASLLDRSIDAAQCADADDRRPSVPISLISAEG